MQTIFTKVTKKQSGEFGLVAILVFLFLALYFKKNWYVVAAFVCTLITLIVPIIFYPFAVFWFGLSKILNMISSRVMMAIIFFLVVTPIGLLRKLTGADSLKIKQFKKSNQSVMLTRDHQYEPADLEKIF
jgi:uncharacterized membrane protein